MKKLLALLLFMMLSAALVTSHAEGVADLPSVTGMTVEAMGDDDGPLRCDYTIIGDSAVMDWTDGDQAWYVCGDTDSVARAYMEAMSIGGWESCLYTVDDTAILSYGVDSEMELSTLDEYCAEIADAFGNTDDVLAEESAGQHYVLNTNTKKFHYPSCSSVGKIKNANRDDYTGSREDLISRGYAPCGNCKP